MVISSLRVLLRFLVRLFLMMFLLECEVYSPTLHTYLASCSCYLSYKYPPLPLRWANKRYRESHHENQGKIGSYVVFGLLRSRRSGLAFELSISFCGDFLFSLLWFQHSKSCFLSAEVSWLFWIRAIALRKWFYQGIEFQKHLSPVEEYHGETAEVHLPIVIHYSECIHYLLVITTNDASF